MDRVITRFPGRLGVQQRVLPLYRVPFFDALAAACDGGLGVFAGVPRPDEAIAITDSLLVSRHFPARNLHLLRGPLYLCYQRGLVEWLNDWHPDALIVEANPRYLSTPAALNWAKRMNVPVIGWGLGAPPLSGPLSAVRQKGRLRFLSCFDALVTYSRRGADEYTALGFPADRIFVAPNASSPRPSAPLPQRPPAFDGRPTVLFVGRLQARKRVDDLLCACASLPETLQPRLLIVGEGPEREKLESLAKRVYPRAEFVGPKFKDELAPYFSAADLFVLPGTGGLAVQEAMSYGLPVIMGQGDGTNDDLVRSANGWQIPPDNPEALAETLRTALSDVARLRAMGAETYRIAAEEINLEKMVGVFVDVLAFCSGVVRRA
jgi:glycosyltransferase involved in cell wall biosynthesis